MLPLVKCNVSCVQTCVYPMRVLLVFLIMFGLSLMCRYGHVIIFSNRCHVFALSCFYEIHHVLTEVFVLY